MADMEKKALNVRFADETTESSSPMIPKLQVNGEDLPYEPELTFWTRPVTFPYPRMTVITVAMQVVALLYLITARGFPVVAMELTSMANVMLLSTIWSAFVIPMVVLSFTMFFLLPIKTDFINAIPLLMLWNPLIWWTESRALLPRLQPWDVERSLTHCELVTNITGCLLILTLTVSLTYTTFFNHFVAYNKRNEPVSLSDIYAVGWGTRKEGFVWEKTTQFRFGFSKWVVRKESARADDYFEA